MTLLGTDRQYVVFAVITCSYRCDDELPILISIKRKNCRKKDALGLCSVLNSVKTSIAEVRSSDIFISDDS